MNVVITVSTYYPCKDGVSVVTQYLAEGLAKKGNKVKVITSIQNSSKSNETHNGVEIERINLQTRFGLYFGNKNGYRRIMEKEANRADVLISVCTQNAFTDVILKEIQQYKCKKILYMHGMFDFEFHLIHFSSFISMINKLWKEVRWFWYYKNNKKYFKKYDSVIQLHKEDYGNKFFRKKYSIKSTIIGNAADDMFFNQEKPKSLEKPFDKYFVYVANYCDRKNQKLAVSEFLKSNIDPKIGLIIIGSDRNSYYDHLEQYIESKRKKNGLTSEEKPIQLLYSLDRKCIPFYVSNAYLSLMTSKWEAFPISVVESIASGVPYISTDVGIVKCFSGGIISEKASIHCWIEKMINNPEMRNKMAETCKEYGKDNFRIEDKVNLLEKEIERLVKDKKR